MNSKILKEISLDPGIGFTAVSIFLYASSTNMLGLLSCITAFIISVTIKYFSITTDKKKKSTGLNKILFDQRLTLWISSLTLFLVAIDSLLLTNFLAVLASCSFATANIRIAESISHEENYEEQNLITLIFSRPDLYIYSGTAVSCLMAGNEALFVLPIVIIALVISLQNAWFKRAESYLHPKLLIALTSFISMFIGVINGNILIAFAHMLIFLIYLNIEARITEGGFKQVIADVKALKK